MNASIRIVVVLSFLPVLAGCASLSGAGNVDTGAVLRAAAAGASGDYAKAVVEIAKLVEKRTSKAGAADPLAGFTFTRTYFYDGAPVPDPSRITWTDQWSKTGSAGKESVPVSNVVAAASASEAAFRAEIAAILKAAGIGEE